MEKKKNHNNEDSISSTVTEGAPACGLCGRIEHDLEKYGEKLVDEETKLTVHYNCLILATGLLQQGEETDGFYGFLINDVKNKIKQASKVACIICKKKGASIACNKKNCWKTFHFPCGQENKFLFQYFDTYVSFCSAHIPVQKVPADKCPSECCICLEKLDPVPSYDVIKSPCCKMTWFHRPCLQKYALSAALYFFKCPKCNTKDCFQKEMLRMGIHIPERDASWELEENAFVELLHVHRRCDVERCLCKLGRGYYKEKSKWNIVRCRYCGANGTHLACSSLASLHCKWACSECFFITKRKNNQQKALLQTDDTMSPLTSCQNNITPMVLGEANQGLMENKTDKLESLVLKENASTSDNNNSTSITSFGGCNCIPSTTGRRTQLRPLKRERDD